jgi:FkbM family methyltransferase
MIFYDQNNSIIDINNIEKPEQDLANKYILPTDIVLELGARYGTVSCTINKKLHNKKNQVVVEPDNRVWEALEKNKNINNCDFNIVKGFISRIKLDVAHTDRDYGTTSVVNENSETNCYTMEEIKAEYNINKFNVLIADCEGGLEMFLNENPSLYNDIRMIIFEADYPDKCNYNLIKSNLQKHNFYKVEEGHQNVWIKNNLILTQRKNVSKISHLLSNNFSRSTKVSMKIKFN